MSGNIDFATEFRKYWNAGGRYLSENNAGRTLNNICGWLNECNSVYDIDNHVLKMRTRRESTREIIVDFLNYLSKEKGRKFLTELSGKRFYDDVLERRLEIAKYLHEPHTPREIQEHFDISVETQKKDLKALRDGLEAFGTTIELEEMRVGRKRYYKATVHPIFLALNLTEVYAMTEYLQKRVRPGDPNSLVVKTVIDRIKAQLSDYAWEKLYNMKRPDDHHNYYISDETLANTREGIKMYLEKSGRTCSFYFNGKQYHGKIDRRGRIQLDNGDYLDVDLRSVEFIIDDLEYK